MLSVDVYGRQDILDNSLADRAPTDGRPRFTWTGGGRGSFDEIKLQSDWRNAVADDREVIFIASSDPGRYEIQTVLANPGDCQPAIGDETAEDALARCSAKFAVKVRRPSDIKLFAEPPINPSGVIPEVITDSDGIEFNVFTPEQGGSFLGDGFSLAADPGAVNNDEYIGMRISPTGVASNAGKTWQRYTLVGTKYSINVADAAGEAISSFTLNEVATVCVRLPEELRSEIAKVVLAVIDDDQELTVLSTSVKIGTEGIRVCGTMSRVPAMVAVGSIGAPPELVEEEPLPDTGGVAPAHSILMVLSVVGIAMIGVGFSVSRNSRRRRTSVRLP